jgi:uncharacterized surface anchored protein
MRRSTLRRIVGSSIVVAATVLPAGIAAAADYPNPPPPSVAPNTGTTTQVEAASTTKPSTLPFTGGDVAGLAVIGAGAAIAGTVMVRRSKRHAAT